jgi:hypothetical protein
MAGSGKERWCPYGKPAGHWVMDTGGWVTKHHFRSQTKRSMCPACQATRKLPRQVLERMTEEEREGRREVSRAIQRESVERKK